MIKPRLPVAGLLIAISTCGSMGPAAAALAEEAGPAVEADEPGRASETGEAAGAAETTLEDLEQRLRILERLREIEAEQAAEKAKQTSTAGAGRDGFYFRSAGGEFILRLRGLVQTDGGFYQGDDSRTATDTFQMSRVRPILEATVHEIYDLRITPDFGLGRTVLQDAYVDARFHPAVKVRAGKAKTPFGLERLQSASDLLLVSRALPTNLVPNRDVGIHLHGDLAGGIVSYAGAILNGVPDGGSADADTNDAKEGAGRLFLQPFRKTSIAGLQGLGIGVAATIGTNRGLPSATGLAPYKSAGQRNFFAYRSSSTSATANTVVADGRRARLSPQLWYYAGRFGLLAEYVRTSQDVRIGSSEERIDNASWQASASFFLTADEASYKLAAPRKDFDPGAGSPGGIEVVARYGRLTVDEDAFPVFADPGASAEEATETAAGVNWYVNRNLRVMVDWSRTSYEGGAASGEREDERVVLSRIQISF